MVLLLGACPEYGCLVYEHMANGSLDDCLFRRGKNPVLPWQFRFRIAAEIATGLLFLHQTKPEPLVHRDLKPGNILLDRNFVSKISDVGLARLVPPSVADIGVMLLQIVTAKSPMGLTHHVERAIENGTFEQMLDPEVHDWPELNRLRALAEDSMPNYAVATSPRKPPIYNNSHSHVSISLCLF